MKKVIAGLILMFASAAVASPSADQLTKQEQHELKLVAMERQQIQEAIDKSQAEWDEILTRLKKAHNMTDEDDFDLNNGKVVRGVHKKKEVPAAEKKDAPKAPVKK